MATPDLPQSEALIIALTNAFRQNNELAIVRSDPKLSKAASDYAAFLARSGLFSHQADGRRPVDRINAAGYQHCNVAENLAWFSDERGFSTRQLATEIVAGWKKSPGHRKNMELPHVTEIGVAIAKASRQEKYYAVQLFARPARLKYQFAIENRTNRPVNYTFGTRDLTVTPLTVVTHTACSPYKLKFKVPTGANKHASTFEARDHSTYKITANGDGKLRIDTLSDRQAGTKPPTER